MCGHCGQDRNCATLADPADDNSPGGNAEILLLLSNEFIEA